MLGIAENYERLAEHAERRSKRNNSRTIKLIHYRQAARAAPNLSCIHIRHEKPIGHALLEILEHRRFASRH
jgi:hypothetical protein